MRGESFFERHTGRNPPAAALAFPYGTVDCSVLEMSPCYWSQYQKRQIALPRLCAWTNFPQWETAQHADDREKTRPTEDSSRRITRSEDSAENSSPQCNSRTRAPYSTGLRLMEHWSLPSERLMTRSICYRSIELCGMQMIFYSGESWPRGK